MVYSPWVNEKVTHPRNITNVTIQETIIHGSLNNYHKIIERQVILEQL